MLTVTINLIFLIYGAFVSGTFLLCSKIKCTYFSRIAIDFALTLLTFVGFYVLCFFLLYGEITVGCAICTAVGFIIPRLFVPLNKN